MRTWTINLANTRFIMPLAPTIFSAVKMKKIFNPAIVGTVRVSLYHVSPMPSMHQVTRARLDIARVVLTRDKVLGRGPLLRRGTRMDHQCVSDWIEPLEATALSADAQAEVETHTVSIP